MIPVEEAEKLEAPQQDVELAKASVPVEQRPAAAPQADVDDLRNAMRLSNANADGRDHDGRDRGWDDRDWKDRDWKDHDWDDHDWDDHDWDDHDWDDHDWDDRHWNKKVCQWDRDWVRYDDYYRPIFYNPYRHTVKIIYVYQYQPRIVLIPPLASVVLEVIEHAAYNFTALLFDPVGTVLNVAVGSFFGGGYYPGPNLAPPPPPPPLLTYDQVPVVVNYREAEYEPFLVNRIVDVGDDARFGERKVLLDGVTPVWGQWTQTPDGQRQFEVHKTQQFPGLVDPQEGPLPGDYKLRLVSTPSSGFTAKDVYGVAASAVAVTLALCLAAFGISRRRSRGLH